MSAFVAHTLRDVPSSAAMSTLGTDSDSLGVSVAENMEAVTAMWSMIEGALTIIPDGSPTNALDEPLASAKEFAEAMSQVKSVLVNAAGETFAKLEQTRAELQGTIQNLNDRHRSHSLILDQEIAAYVADPENDPIITGRNHPETDAYATAKVNLDLLDQEAARLALEVDLFHREMAQAEQDLADKIRNISGGDEVTRRDGSRVTTSQTAWGLYPPAAAPGPGEAPRVVSLDDYFGLAVARATAQRIEWFATATDQDLEDWLATHPDFFATVGFIPPAQAQALYDRLRSRSTQDASGIWVTGPLSALWNRAPATIGNLNGIPASVRAEFGARELERLLGESTLTEDQRAKLNLLLDETAKGSHVLSLFLDGQGEVRGSLFVGDLDSADHVITVTHGIETDFGAMNEWGRIATDLAAMSNEQLRLRGMDPSTAVVLFMEWDSGAWYTVQGMKEPVLGADREAALVAGMRFVNPDAWQEGWAHSLGTTMVTTNQIHNPGVFDHLTLFGSAGITEGAAKALAAQIADETVSVSAASSGLDPIAWMGRTDLSTHPVDPKTVEGVTEIGSHGGAVENYLNADGREVTGAATQGHNAGPSTEIIYRIHRAPYWHLGFIPEESVGYLDPRSEAMMQAVADFAERVEARQ
jgi:hypothetical protein